MDMLTRAKIATDCKTDLAFAQWLGLTQSVIAGYKKRGNIPQEQCIKIAEKTGVSLDWLILGRGENNAPPQQTQTTPELNSDEIMLLTGWKFLDNDQRDAVFDLIRRLARGEDTVQAVKHVINIHGNVAQANAGNGSIENVNL